MKRRKSILVFSVLLGVLAALVALALPARSALADVKLDGDWTKPDAPLALDVSDLSLSEALRRLAAAAGWSLVVSDAPKETVDLHIKDQPARKVLGLLLANGKYIARRDGDLVAIRPIEDPSASAPAAAPPPSALAIPPIPPIPPIPLMPLIATRVRERRGEDRTITGGNFRLAEGESAHDVMVYGGNAEVLGTVTGDLSVFGGAGHVGKRGHVVGDVTVMGGVLRLDDGARVDGDVGVLGGRVERAAGASVGGSMTHSGEDSGDEDDADKSDADAGKGEKGHDKGKHDKSGGGLLAEIGSAVTGSALLFVFGAVLLALRGERMETLRAEVAMRPMRSFALGVVGSIAAIAIVVALCVTLVGIPVAVVGILLAILAVYAGIAAVLTTAGEALLRHRTKSPYMHLAVGCGLLLLVGSIPFVGGMLKATVALLGIGVLIATRGAGLVPPKALKPPVDA